MRPRPRWMLIVATLALLASNAAAEGPGVGAAPSSVDFGRLAVGAVAQASFRFQGCLQERGQPERPRFDTPSFLRLDGFRTGTLPWRSGRLSNCEVDFSVDTGEVGRFEGILTVEMGTRSVSVPVTAEVVPRVVGRPRVLVVESPWHPSGGGSQPWLDLVARSGIEAEYRLVRRDRPILPGVDLEPFDVVLFSAGALFWASDGDFATLQDFAIGGGRVLLFASRFFSGSVPAANRFLDGTGLRMIDVDFERGSLKHLLRSRDDILEDPLTDGLTAVGFQYSVAPVYIEDPLRGRALVREPLGTRRPIVALTPVGEGEIVVLGTPLWTSWIGRKSTEPDGNRRLLENLLTKDF